jgi:DNA invertase Pin-like site-specific DNA recombinase
MTDTLHIYTRVSTSVQEEEGTSLQTQRELGIQKSKELGFQYKVWNEGGASSKHEDLNNRPVLKKLLMEVEDGEVRHLWVYNNDRLSRNDITQQTIRISLQKHGVKLYTKDGQFDLSNPTDQLIKTVLDGIAQYDNALRTERSRLGKLNRVRQGFWMGGPPPFGYEIEGHKLLPNPLESGWVKKIYQWTAQDKSTEWIRGELDKNGVQTRHRKGTWSLGSIQKILRNTHYRGHYTYKDSKLDETVECSCPPIISDVLWNRVQERMEKRLQRKGQKNRTTRFYLLRDLMFCGHCGTPMGGRSKPSKNERLYYCVRKERDWVKKTPKKEDKWVRGRGCDMVRSLNIPRTDKLVWDCVVESLSNSHILKDRVQRRFVDKANHDTELLHEKKKTKRLVKELGAIQKTIADFETKHLLDTMDDAIVQNIRTNLQERLQKVKGQIDQSRLKTKEMGNRKQWMDAISRLDTEMEKVAGFTDPQKRRFLEFFVERIDVRLDHDTNEHELIVRFRLPLVGDYQDDDGDAVPGQFEKGIRLPPLKTTPQ